MKLLKPTLRQRKRYITFKVISNNTITYDEVKDATEKKLLSLIGEKGVSESSMRLIKNLWNEKEKKGVLRTVPKYVNEVKTAQSLIRKIGRKNVIIKSGKVFGTLRKIKQGAS